MVLACVRQAGQEPAVVLNAALDSMVPTARSSVVAQIMPLVIGLVELVRAQQVGPAISATKLAQGVFTDQTARTTACVRMMDPAIDSMEVVTALLVGQGLSVTYLARWTDGV